MDQPEIRHGAWWTRGPDGRWLRWDQRSNAWEPQHAPPPPPTPEEAAASAGGTYQQVAYRSTTFRSPRGIGQASVVFLVTAAVVEFISLLSHLASRSMYLSAAQTGFLGQQDALAASMRQGVIALAQLALLLGTGIVFLVWFHRCYKNLAPLGAGELKHSTGWAIGSWFVPILNLFLPKQLADDMWRATDPDAPVVQGMSWRQRKAPAVISGWWIMWLLANFTSPMWGGFQGVGTLESAATSVTLVAASNGISMVAGILAALFVSRLTTRQEARFVNIQSEEPELLAA